MAERRVARTGVQSRHAKVGFNAADASRTLRGIDHISSSEATHSISISMRGSGSACTTQVVRAG